jgi:hypothetical protein
MRWRRMFYLTGLPGWLRFGFSPGWRALPPGAAYLFGQVSRPMGMECFPSRGSVPVYRWVSQPVDRILDQGSGN